MVTVRAFQESALPETLKKSVPLAFTIKCRVEKTYQNLCRATSSCQTRACLSKILKNQHLAYSLYNATRERTFLHIIALALASPRPCTTPARLPVAAAHLPCARGGAVCCSQGACARAHTRPHTHTHIHTPHAHFTARTFDIHNPSGRTCTAGLSRGEACHGARLPHPEQHNQRGSKKLHATAPRTARLRAHPSIGRHCVSCYCHALKGVSIHR
jgi:hypothetical protein